MLQTGCRLLIWSASFFADILTSLRGEHCMQIFPDSRGIMEKEKTVQNPSVLKVGQVIDKLEDIDSKRANILTTDETEKSSSL